jgi:predicted adenylyl cyclase CyaB
MQNIEIKYRANNLIQFEEFLNQQLGICRIYQHSQKDIYFTVPDGRLKLRIEDEKKPHIIRYFRPDVAKTRISNYAIEEVDNPEVAVQKVSTEYPLLAVVEKIRTLYLFKNVRIHLDRVKLLGEFVEFESVIDAHTDYKTAKLNLNKLLKLVQRYLDTAEASGYLELIMKGR